MLAVLGIAESSRATLLAELDRIGSNLLTVGSGQTFLGDDSALPEESTAMIDRIGPVEAASSVSAIVGHRPPDRPDHPRRRQAASPSRRPTTICSRRSAARSPPAGSSTTRSTAIRRSCSAPSPRSARDHVARRPGPRLDRRPAGGASSGSSTHCRWPRRSTAPRWSGREIAEACSAPTWRPTTIYVRAEAALHRRRPRRPAGQPPIRSIPRRSRSAAHPTRSRPRRPRQPPSRRCSSGWARWPCSSAASASPT